jgi:short-subunit dehydrogenase
MQNGARRFENKVVVVTGASSGIGAAAARSFAAEGATVALVARTEKTLEGVVSEIRSRGGRALAVRADVGDHTTHEPLFDRVANEFGGIDVLVNNAGVNYRGAVKDRSATELAQIVNVNLTAPILLCRAVIPHLERRDSGAIVNVASLAGRVPLPHEATYSATKFGLRGFSFSLGEELMHTKIRVAVVSPGPVDTGFIMSEIDEVPDLVFSQPMSTSEDIAKLVLDAALGGATELTPSRQASYLTTFGYLFPKVRQGLRPLLERQGRTQKERFRKRAAR